MQSFRKLFVCLAIAIVSSALTVYAEDEKIEHDNSRISIFVQPSVSFLDFEHRKYFQNAVDTIYQSFRESAVTESESLNVAKQDFQKVNFCFPVSAGLQFQIAQDHFVSAGIGFIYDNESVVLMDHRNRAHNYSYTIQGVPLFLEYRLAIPKNFLSLSNSSLFSIAARWYWVLPGTEIYTTWGQLEAKTPITGAGFGISLGYLVASWKGFNIYGDIGFSSIAVESEKKFSDIVPDGPEEKVKWNIGGLQMQFRVSFGLWNKPKVEDDSTTVTKADLKSDSKAELKFDSEKKEKSDETARPENSSEAGKSEVSDESVKTESPSGDVKNESSSDAVKTVPEE